MPPFPATVLASALWLVMAALVRAEEPLLSAGQVHRLSLKESSAGVPVKLSGVITYVRGQGSGMVLQDATGGVMLEWPHIREGEKADPEIKVGALAEIEGHTATNPPTPRIYVTSFKLLGTSDLPVPEEMDVGELLGSDLDGSFVTCEGVVRAIRAEGDVIPSRLVIEFGPASGRLFIWISRWTDETRRAFQPGSTIRVQGVLMRWKTVNWMPLVPFVVVNQPEWITLVSPPPDFADVPRKDVDDIQMAASDSDYSEAFRVSGTVTFASHDAVVIARGNETLWIRPREQAKVVPGDRVEAVGFPGMNGPRAELEDAVIRKNGTTSLGKSEVLTPADFQNRGVMWMDGRRTKLRGTMIRSSSDPNEAPRAIQFGDRQIPLLFAERPSPDELPSLDSIVEVEGVLEAGLTEQLMRVGRGVGAYQLHVQNIGDLRVISPGPWWTPAKVTTAFFIITAVAGAAAIWALFLNRRVAEKSRALVQEINARREQEIVSDERRRLAADLHDTLEQTLTGASLQLEALGPVETAKPLVLAKRLLDRSRDELRRAVWDLTPDVLVESGFRAALESIASESNERGLNVEVSFSGDEGIVAERIATHLCRIARESISNAVRHGKAGVVGLDVNVNEERVVLSIEDDGHGFIPDQAPGISSGHFGINGMKERARRMGGSVRIDSAPGNGTRVEITCPPRIKETEIQPA